MRLRSTKAARRARWFYITLHIAVCGASHVDWSTLSTFDTEGLN